MLGFGRAAAVSADQELTSRVQRAQDERAGPVDFAPNLRERLQGLYRVGHSRVEGHKGSRLLRNVGSFQEGKFQDELEPQDHTQRLGPARCFLAGMLVRSSDAMPYFDHNATTPLAPVARETWLRASDENWHNPSSPYRDAAKAKIRLDNAREQLAEFLSTDPKSLVFNSGATEGAHAVLAYLAQHAHLAARLAVSRTEHPCVLEAARRYFGERIVWLDTTRSGAVPIESVSAVLAAGACAGVVLMAANNETGVLQPWQKVGQACRDARVPLICDASQWLGKLPAAELGECDWVIGAGHKFGAPKGVGFIKCAAQADGFQAQPGGEQEGGRRGGTENLSSIWAMVAALAFAEQKKVFLETERLAWRRDFERSVVSALPGALIVAADAERLWNTVSLSLPRGENIRWVTKLDKLGFQVSTGSACATGKAGPSHVLSALGLSTEQAQRTIRISSGWETTREEWQALVTALIEVNKSWTESNVVVTA